MRIKLKRLRDQVIVITGASSGSGLTTAELAAEAGARVVMSSRNEDDRMDRGGAAPVAVTLIKPSAINTPFIEHAGNDMEVEPQFPPPVYAPEVVARAILRCAVRPAREINVGGAGRMITAMGAVAPRLTDLYMESTTFDQQRSDRPEQGDDALDEPQRDGRRRGPTERITLNRSAYARAALSDVGRAIPALAAGVLVMAALRRQGSSRRQGSMHKAQGATARFGLGPWALSLGPWAL